MKTEEKELPKSNVLYFELENDYWVAARPSGTEPLVRVMIEGEDQEYITKRAKEIADLIEKKLK